MSGANIVSLGVHDNIEALRKDLDAIQQKALPRAVVIALNVTAEIVRINERVEMRDSFDRPTPFTLKSLYVKKATMGSLTSRVWLKGDYPQEPAHYLAPQIEGGGRNWKRFETMLQSVGALPTGMYAVPGSGAQLDGYGNMARGQIVQILSYFRSFSTAGYSPNSTPATRARMAKGTKSKRGFAYFVASPGDRLPLGVWQRIAFGHGSAIKPVLIFVSSVHYQKRFDFYFVANQTVQREFPKQLAAALRNGLTKSGGTA